MCLYQDQNEMGNAAIISHCVPSSCVYNAMLSTQTFQVIPSRQMYVAIDNPSLIPSFRCLTTSTYWANYLCTAGDVSHVEQLQSNDCQCFSQLNKFQDQFHVI